MKYHVMIEYTKYHFWWNFDKEEVISKLLIPFINGQVVLIKSSKGQRLLNLKSVSRLSVYKTKNSLVAIENKSVSKQMLQKSFEQYECTKEIIEETKLELASQQSQ